MFYLLPHPGAYIPLPTKILHFLFFFFLNSKKCTSFLFLFSDLPRAPAVKMSAFTSVFSVSGPECFQPSWPCHVACGISIPQLAIGPRPRQ